MACFIGRMQRMAPPVLFMRSSPHCVVWCANAPILAGLPVTTRLLAWATYLPELLRPQAARQPQLSTPPRLSERKRPVVPADDNISVIVVKIRE